MLLLSVEEDDQNSKEEHLEVEKMQGEVTQ